MPIKYLQIYDNQRISFQNKPAHIKERKNPEKLKKLPKWLIRFLKKTPDNPSGYISSLYESRKPAIMAFEYRGKHYILNTENMVIQDDSEGLYNQAKQDFQKEKQV